MIETSVAAHFCEAASACRIASIFSFTSSPMAVIFSLEAVTSICSAWNYWALTIELSFGGLGFSVTKTAVGKRSDSIPSLIKFISYFISSFI